jgi:hypothetical protein
VAARAAWCAAGGVSAKRYERARVFENGKGHGIMYWPARPLRVTRELAQLADSNPTPEEYERRKREILEAHGD